MAVTNGRSTSQWRLKVIRPVHHHPPPYCVPALLAPSEQGLIAGRMGLCQGKQSLFLSARLLQQVAHIPHSPLIRLSKLAVSLSLSLLCHFSPLQLAWLCWWPQSKDNYLGEGRRQLSPINARLTTPEWRRPPFNPAQRQKKEQANAQRRRDRVMRGRLAWNCTCNAICP